MDIKSVTVSLSSGDNYVIPMRLGGASQTAIKDLLLTHLLAESKSNKQCLSIFASKVVSRNIEPVSGVKALASIDQMLEMPVLLLNTYNGRQIKKWSKEYLFKEAVLTHFHKTNNEPQHPDKLAIITRNTYKLDSNNGNAKKYLNCMIRSNVLSRISDDSSCVEINKDFTNQAKQIGVKK